MNIIAKRLVLRPFESKDALGLLDYLSKPVVSCFVGDKIATLEEALEMIKKRQKKNDYLAVCLKESDQIIGEVFQIFEDPDTYSVGWNFNHEFQGLGYARESAQALFNHLFSNLNCRRIYAFVEEDNYASKKLCERLGMRKEGCFVEFISFVNYEDGTPKYENTLQYAILKREWQSMNNLDEKTTL